MADKTPRKGRPKARAKNAPAKCARVERLRRVWELRLRNKTISDIAVILKAEGFKGAISTSTVQRDLNEQMERETQQARATKAQMRQQIAGRLDAMMELLWSKALSGDANAVTQLRAMEQMRAIEADRARLFGLNDHEEEIIVPVGGSSEPARTEGQTGALVRMMTPEEVEEARSRTRKSAGVLPAE